MNDRSYVGVVSLHTLPDLTPEPTHDQIRAWLVKNARRVGSYWSIAQILGARAALIAEWEEAHPPQTTPHVLLPADWATHYTRTVTVTANDPAPEPMERSKQWRTTGGSGTATIVSRIGGPAFAVLRHGEPDVGLAEMVAAALNACPWLTVTVTANDPEPAERRCGPTVHGFECVLPWGHNRGKADIPENHHAAGPAPTGDDQP